MDKVSVLVSCMNGIGNFLLLARYYHASRVDKVIPSLPLQPTSGEVTGSLWGLPDYLDYFYRSYGNK